MALEEVVQRAIDAGVRHFELTDEWSVGEETTWHWDVYSSEPYDRHYLPNLTDIDVEWLGFGLGGGRPLGVLPFRVEIGRTFIVLTPKMVDRAGCQGLMADSVEHGLLLALRAYVCDFDRPTCPHDWCPHFSDCDLKAEDWL